MYGVWLETTNLGTVFNSITPLLVPPIIGEVPFVCTNTNETVDKCQGLVRCPDFRVLICVYTFTHIYFTYLLISFRLSCSLECLATLPNLTSLNLSACGLTHVHLTPWRVGSLCHLSLAHNTFNRDKGVSLATYLSSCDALQHLSLADCSLDHMISPSLWHSITSELLVELHDNHTVQ